MPGASVTRRGLIIGAGAMAAAAISPKSLAAATQGEPVTRPLPPPIGRDERMSRLSRARELMQRNGIGAVLVESGPSLEYYTGSNGAAANV